MEVIGRVHGVKGAGLIAVLVLGAAAYYGVATGNSVVAGVFGLAAFLLGLALRPSPSSEPSARSISVTKSRSHSQTSEAPSLLDELAKLADLRDRGVLSEDEFLARKKRLLDL